MRSAGTDTYGARFETSAGSIIFETQEAGHVIANSGTGNFGIGVTTGGAPTEKLDVVGNANVSGVYKVGGVAGVTQTGAYTNFTIVGGIITAAS